VQELLKSTGFGNIAVRMQLIGPDDILFGLRGRENDNGDLCEAWLRLILSTNTWRPSFWANSNQEV